VSALKLMAMGDGGGVEPRGLLAGELEQVQQVIIIQLLPLGMV